MDNPEADEWEYEYDETETDEFYVTLDLSGILPTGHEGIDPAYIPSIERRRRTGRPSYKNIKSKTRAMPTDQPVALDAASDLESQSNTDALDSSRIQILDLHTSNPLIGYQGQLLSCHWASTVGTDMLFARSEPDLDTRPSPLRKLPSFDLLGLSSTKLMASTAQLRPRDDNPVIEKEPSPFPDRAMRRRSSATINAGNANPLLSTSKAKINQQNFLNRLNVANAKRKRDAESTTTLPTRRARSSEDTSIAEVGAGEATSIQEPPPSMVGGDVIMTEGVLVENTSIPDSPAPMASQQERSS